MKTIKLQTIIDSTYLSSDGLVLYSALSCYFDTKTPIKLSFDGIQAFSSSFFNSSLGQLLDNYGMNTFKEVVSFVDVNGSQAKWLRKYLDDYKNLSHA
ncbi:STAS-like domain-containing protein [Arcticibacterium luteifluviistationis]|uniref:DUF4325 domain-containing protein n=1 Tax=Arcticibacterium luteifluviistationis TaxID=1784714 RepID=A0A2Z4GEH5_9BACT|nr:DUF4325 domain-containing protein [Arcticibacterium luteifluviistationis]AWV99388.1 hypothetical protein DJ013_14960 [Arcticibacterium luteifluviistationis]